eukprot:scaffold3598_cov139-Skeletonema_menzelii.AAC.11
MKKNKKKTKNLPAGSSSSINEEESGSDEEHSTQENDTQLSYPLSINSNTLLVFYPCRNKRVWWC